jgi:hypothetical protein
VDVTVTTDITQAAGGITAKHASGPKTFSANSAGVITSSG